ncbi:MAG: tetratricopeptide repeat protein, partial [Planctomycetes bacterium]|nr:tetratricopeptide repeat protein [Planctomycetota bacterium]
QQDDFAKALPLFQQVATKKVKQHHVEALYRCGACAGNLKNWPVSQQHYTALIQTFPKFEQLDESRYGLAWAVYNQRKLPEAKAILAQVPDTASEASAKSRFLLGSIDFEEEKHELAIEHFLFVAANYPYKEWQMLSRYEAGRCFKALGKKPQAIQQLQIVVDKFPNDPKAKAAAAMIADLKK